MTPMLTPLISIALFGALLFGCKQRPPSKSRVSSLKNGIDCADMTQLETNNLGGIEIVDLGINASEKIRHLNELNRMPEWYLAAVRPHVEIILGNSGLSSFPGKEHLKGVRPRGWPEGSTWDDVAGGANGYVVDSRVSVRLSNSGLVNDARSLAIHEISHGIDT